MKIWIILSVILGMIGSCGQEDLGSESGLCGEPLEVAGSVSLDSVNLTFTFDLTDYPGEIVLQLTDYTVSVKPEMVGLRWFQVASGQNLVKCTFTDGPAKGDYSISYYENSEKSAKMAFNVYPTKEGTLSSDSFEVRAFDACADLFLQTSN